MYFCNESEIFSQIKGKAKVPEPIDKKQNQIMIAKKVLQENKKP
jgi:hypothetical protein